MQFKSKMDNNKYQCECKNLEETQVCKNDYIRNPASWSCKNGQYLESIIDDSVITCDEIIDVGATSYDEETEIVSTNFSNKKVIFKTKSFYILLAFLIIIIAFLISVSVYYYLIKSKPKQKHLLRYYVTNNKPIKNCINNML